MHAVDLAGGLSALGHVADLVALAPGTHGDLLAMPTLADSRRSPSAMRRLRSMSKDYDVVVAHGSTTLPVCAIALTGSTPFVYRQISDPLFWAATPARRLRTGVALRSAAAIVALSDDVGRTFAEHYRLDPAGITTIPNAVPGESWPVVTPDERAATRARLEIPDDAPVVVFLAALVPEKGCDLAIESVAAIDDAHLVIIGDGPEATALRQLAAELNTGRVHFTGPTSAPRELLAAGDCIVLPSRGGDSMPATLIEAGLCGLPAVSTPVGAIPAVISDGETGRIVPIDDRDALQAAIEFCIQPDRRPKLAAAARRHCEAHFTIEAVAPAWVDLLAQL